MTVAPLNPFTSQAVSSLRKIEPPIRWLNDAALRKLLAVFEVVEEKPHRCELVQVILSRGDGYGKSHLLGRLIKALDGRATCVSVADYHDPLTCWVTLLQSILNELSQPELIHHLPYPPTQLDEMAHQIFGFLTAMLADKGVTDTPIPGGNREDLLERPFEKWDLSDPASTLGIWVKETLTACEQDATREAILVRLLKAATLHPYSDDASAMNWLLVLHRYASDRADEESRQMCLEWILTNQLEVPAETFLQNEARLAGNNLIARQQTLDLLALAKLYRPFLLCFDQTSSLNSSLAKSFGKMLEDLVRGEGAHFSIVTANSNLWETIVLPELSPESLSCLATKMELAGLTREQGRSLAEQRLQSNGDPVEFQERFLKKSWLEEQFAQGSLGQRDFLQRCELRYQEMVPDAIKPPGEVETAEAESIPFEPLIQEVIPAAPAPDLTAPLEPPTSASPTGNKTDGPDDLPPLPAIDIAEAQPLPQALPESPVVSVEPAQVPPVSINESSEAAEKIDASKASSVAPLEPAPQKTDLDNAGSEILTLPEPPASAQITDTVRASSSDDLPSLPASNIAEPEPIPESPVASVEPAQIPPASITESPATSDAIDTSNPSNVAPVESGPQKTDVDNTAPEIPVSPVMESPAPAPIADTVHGSAAVSVETSVTEQASENEISKAPESLDQVSAPVLETGKRALPEQPALEEKSPTPTTSSFSTFTPFVEIAKNQTEEEPGEQALPPVLLPPADKEFLIEPAEVADISDADNPAATIQELAKNLAEPEKTAAEEIPPAIASPVVEIEPVSPVLTELVPDVISSAEVSETNEATPVVESGIIESQPEPESPQITIPEISLDSTGQTPNVSLSEEVEQAISTAPLVVEESFINPTPETVVSSPAEFEPQVLATSPESPVISEAPPASGPSEIASIQEPAPLIAEVPAPVAEDSIPTVSEETTPIAPLDDQAELRNALFQIIKAHRFASHVAIADELRRKMQRSVSVEETVLCAQSISEIHVYADGPNAAFLWQGED